MSIAIMHSAQVLHTFLSRSFHSVTLAFSYANMRSKKVAVSRVRSSACEQNQCSAPSLSSFTFSRYESKGRKSESFVPKLSTGVSRYCSSFLSSALFEPPFRSGSIPMQSVQAFSSKKLVKSKVDISRNNERFAPQ